MPTEPANAKEIFLNAVEIASPAERAALLDEACRGNPELRRRVEALLQAHERPESLLDKAAVSADVDLTTDAAATMPFRAEQPGTQIGPYKLLQQIGEGGMGTVFMAEQTHPVQRKVAIKIIKPGMDSRQVIARFEAERQALALMDHPNIAKVLDAGTIGGSPKSEARNPKQIQSTKSKNPNESVQGVSNIGGSDLEIVLDFDIRASDFSQGRPYFVMELVKGTAITQYCDEHRLTPRERLDLFIPVCQALQHAHQKGIIHRDIKPSNVLVALYDGKPVPKVIDFGVAKATGQQLTEHTLVTGFGAVLGTLEYMSPSRRN